MILPAGAAHSAIGPSPLPASTPQLRRLHSTVLPKRALTNTPAQRAPRQGCDSKTPFEQFLPPGHWECLRLPRVWGVPLSMSRIRPENLDPEISDRWVAADVLFREEPDEEEDDEDEQEEDNEEDDDEGYSE
jgi:hypothetical protein